MNRDRFPVVVHLMLIVEGRLALLRRAHTGFMDGYYALPGGHQQQGESVSGALCRECAEELGVVPVDLRPVCLLPYRSGRHQGMNVIFEANACDGEPRINEPELFDDLVWAELDALPTPYPDWIPRALELRAGGAWYAELEWD